MSNKTIGELPHDATPGTDAKVAVQTAAGDTVHALLSELLGAPFTDGDGNVYSIEYDPLTFGLMVKCVTSGGDQSIVFAKPGVAAGLFFGADGTTSGFDASSTIAEVTYQASGGDARSVQLNSSGVVIVGPTTLNGVPIDPTAPWPGG